MITHRDGWKLNKDSDNDTIFLLKFKTIEMLNEKRLNPPQEDWVVESVHPDWVSAAKALLKILENGSF